jgi:NAD(P)-dependent dehydrogenase (short-subunit alcohol dehydrogenase family)
MTDRLENKTALITGGSRGIGRAVAEAYAAEGARIVLNARDPERLQQAAEELRAAYGVDVSIFPCDVVDRDAVEAMVGQSDEADPIDILVNNAGIHKASPFVDYAFEDFRNVIEVNVYGVIHVTQFVLRRMIARKRGVVLNIASTAGKWGSRNQSAYNMSKHAVVGMTRCLGLEMAPYNIRANAICPWVVETDLADSFLGSHAEILGLPREIVEENFKKSIPLNQRWIKPEEVAGLAVYLGSDESSFVTGQAWTVDGGYTMI